MIYELLQAAGQLASSAAAGVPEVVANPTDNTVATIGLGVILSFALQAAKNATWFPLLSRASSRMNFGVGVALAVLATAGVHFTYDPASGGTVTLPSLHAIWQSIIQWGFQQASYKGLVVPAETLGEMRAMLERYATPPPISQGAKKAEDAGGQQL